MTKKQGCGRNGDFMNNSEMNMLISGIIKRKEVPSACVYFSAGKNFAEGYVPECKITSQKGFSEEEIAGLEEYLRANKEDILVKAKGVNPIKAMLKE